MTKTKALNQFFNGFGLPAYPVTAVPDKAVLPYMTYEVSLGDIGDQTDISVGIWYHTSSEAVPNAKAEEIGKAIGLGGLLVHHDDGVIWVKKGNPFMTSVNTQDNSLKHRALNISLEFM